MPLLDMIFLGWYCILAKTIYRYGVPGDYIGPSEHAFFIAFLLHGLNVWTVISAMRAYFVNSDTSLEVGLTCGIIVFLVGYVFFLRNKRTAHVIGRTYSRSYVFVSVLFAIVYAIATFYAMTKISYYIRDNITLKSSLRWIQHNEFLTGTGPEYSMFKDDYPKTKELKNSYAVALATAAFYTANLDNLQNGRSLKSLTYFNVPYGSTRAAFTGLNMSGQFVGGVRISIIPTGAQLLYIVNNTTDKNSYRAHIGGSIPRQPNAITPQGTIYQRFVWLNP